MDFRNETFENRDVDLDFNTFKGCTFRSCRMVFRGFGAFEVIGNHFDDTIWRLDGPAGTTIHFLASVYHGFGQFGQQWVEALFDQLRNPPPPEEWPGEPPTE